MLWVVVSSAALVACGSGGLTAITSAGAMTSSGTSAPDNLLGVYSGSALQGSVNKTVFGVVLASGEYYFAEMAPNQVVELVHGTSVAQGGTLTSTDMMDFPSAQNPLTGSLAGTYVLASSISGNLNYTSNTVTPQSLSLTYQLNSNAPQLPTAVARSWNFTDNTGASGTLTVDGYGNVSGSTSSSGCTLSGTMSPGNAAYNLTLNLTNCVVSGSLSGVAVLNPGTGGLALMAMTPTRNGAWVASAM